MNPSRVFRKKRYPDYQLHPHKWPITEVLTSYFVPDKPGYIDLEGDEFFRECEKTRSSRGDSKVAA